MKQLLEKSCKLLLIVICFIALGYFCNFQTKGFWLQEILSDVPSDERYNTLPLAKQEQDNIQHLLEQPFTYLGSGMQCHAFLSQDGQTVLKFFKHDQCYPEMTLRHIPLPAMLEPLRCKIVQYRARDVHSIFKSCKIAYEELKEESGLIYLHINKTHNLHGMATLIDNLGITHRVNLDATEFALQKHCTLLFSKIDEQMRLENMQGAKQSIKMLLDGLTHYYQKGIKIQNPAIQRNVGFNEHAAIYFDTGSFEKQESLKNPEKGHQELLQATKRLCRWLRKHHPSLLPYYEDEMRKRESLSGTSYL